MNEEKLPEETGLDDSGQLLLQQLSALRPANLPGFEGRVAYAAGYSAGAAAGRGRWQRQWGGLAAALLLVAVASSSLTSWWISSGAGSRMAARNFGPAAPERSELAGSPVAKSAPVSSGSVAGTAGVTVASGDSRTAKELRVPIDPFRTEGPVSLDEQIARLLVRRSPDRSGDANRFPDQDDVGLEPVSLLLAPRTDYSAAAMLRRWISDSDRDLFQDPSDNASQDGWR